MVMLWLSCKMIRVIPDTLIPSEYHIVKSRGVLPLELRDCKYTTKSEEHSLHQVVFPSMRPTGRHEVIMLKRTMMQMLEHAGIKQSEQDQEIEGPSQIHCLINILKKEQDIYNVIFHEIIRQVSVECIERGELLADIRKSYSQLMDRVPRRVMSLHEELLAQRALDRRLSEQLAKFKNTIFLLTNELANVKEHDRQATREGEKTQHELKSALADALKNSSLLDEYHELYEMQRRRLQFQVDTLTEERNLWSSAAHWLSLKVADEHRLNTVKRLHVAQLSWAKLAKHFVILLTEKDTEHLGKMQEHMGVWKELIQKCSSQIAQQEICFKMGMVTIENVLTDLIATFKEKQYTKDGHLVVPQHEAVEHMCERLNRCEVELHGVTEQFSGDAMLACFELLASIREQVDCWTTYALKVFDRHQSESGSGYPYANRMVAVNESVELLLRQYKVQVSGENGVAPSTINLLNSMETWVNRLMAIANGANTLSESEWLRFFGLMSEWLATCIDLQQTPKNVQVNANEDQKNGEEQVELELKSVIEETRKWLTSSTNAIDSDDGRLLDDVSILHTDMVRWLVQLLLRLAPNKEGTSAEACEMAMLATTSTEQLNSSVMHLYNKLEEFCSCVTRCCTSMVMEMIKEYKNGLTDYDAESDLKDLTRLKTETENWIHTAGLLLTELTGITDHDEPPANLAQPQEPHESIVQYQDTSAMSEPDFHEEKEEKNASEIRVPDSQQQLLNKNTSKEQEERLIIQDNMTSEQQILEQHLSGLDVSENMGVSQETSIEYLNRDDNTYPQKLSNNPENIDEYEPLLALNTLQQQLARAEERAQVAESTVTRLQEQLNNAMQQLHMQQRESPATKNDTKPAKQDEVVTSSCNNHELPAERQESPTTKEATTVSRSAVTSPGKGRASHKPSSPKTRLGSSKRRAKKD
ncbi:PREDICTED: axonemal dynein light chain domain-containing protein 1-like isoform X2 [Priapulus caudatus]|uniref:Axonemal dynein light chain domain-containing protein 1-like isoform X2 n=1 Tax=Priapulus caudatus TaxID=37621 RepID=A0ABM1DNH1_PRICU|nr:PREDICTED: axonemal dynein light chain domain-containing protein 1-like isoform X2 [Priapulus caudatus]